jgi:hypothetical protein
MTSGLKDGATGDCAVLCASLQCTQTRKGDGPDGEEKLIKNTQDSHNNTYDPQMQNACTQNCGPMGAGSGGMCAQTSKVTRNGAFAYCVGDDNGKTATSNNVGGWTDDGSSGLQVGLAGFCYNSIAPTCDDKAPYPRNNSVPGDDETWGGERVGGLCFDKPLPGGGMPDGHNQMTGLGFKGRAMLPSLPNNINGPPSGSKFPEVLPWPTDDRCCKAACQGSRNPDDPSTCLQKKFGPNDNTCVQ